MVSLLAATISSQQPVTSTRDVLVFTGRVDAVDRFARLMTLRTDDGLIQTVAVDPELKQFDQVKSGDRVRIRAQESVVVAVRPDAKPSGVVDTTAAGKKTLGDQGANLLQQLNVVVTIESVDVKKLIVSYKTGDDRVLVRYVSDPRLLEGLKRGDVVELTYSRMRAIEIERPR